MNAQNSFPNSLKSEEASMRNKISWPNFNSHAKNNSLPGVVSEWLKEHAWKACNGQKPFESSNLSNSAIKINKNIILKKTFSLIE